MVAEKIAVFPGSFDPLTNGHVDVVNRALAIFDRVLIAVVANPSKTPLFDQEERVSLIRRQFASSEERVVVGVFSGLLVDYLRQSGAHVVIRGLRAISDFDYEAQMALVNKRLDPSVDTLFLMAREEHSYISSTLVKQIAPLGGDVSRMVPAPVAEALRNRFSIRC